jgi:hypothetical protein
MKYAVVNSANSRIASRHASEEAAKTALVILESEMEFRGIDLMVMPLSCPDGLPFGVGITGVDGIPYDACQDCPIATYRLCLREMPVEAFGERFEDNPTLYADIDKLIEEGREKEHMTEGA